jgi:hypothetical protein
MARFMLRAAHYTNDGRRLRAYTTIADTQANALPGDIIWDGLNASNITPFMQPLDSAATVMQTDAKARRYRNT